jgi:hypothetical protein
MTLRPIRARVFTVRGLCHFWARPRDIYLPNFWIFPFVHKWTRTDKIDVMFSWALAACFFSGAMIAFRNYPANL